MQSVGAEMHEVPTLLQVYIVEDSAILLGLLVKAVKATSAQVVGHSDNAQQAIGELALLEPDLILVDIALSSGTGFDVLRALQAGGHARRAIKVVLTNHATAQYRDLSFQLGASHFFDKSSEAWRALELIGQMAAKKSGNVTRPRTRNGRDTNKHSLN